MTKFLRSFFCIMLFGLTSVVVAQEISVVGIIVDAENRPIEFANVFIFNSDESEFISGTSTDELGFFRINNLSSGSYVIKISFIGFELFEQNLILSGNLDLKTISLNEATESLDQINIIAKKPTITRKPDRLIFNVENTALIEGTTLQVLKSTPGIIVSDSGINIKNAPATIFINNRRVQLTANELIQLLESASANSIKSIEVITNPPASYDADSGSVINIIMGKNLVTGYRGSLFTNYTQGVFPRYNAGTSLYYKNNKINVNLNYSYTDQKINRGQESVDNFLDPVNQDSEIWQSGLNRNTWSETQNLNLNFDYYIDDKNTLRLTSTGLYTPYYKYKIINSTSITDENFDFLSRFTSDNLSRDLKHNIGTDLTFRHDFEDQSNLTVNGHYTIYDFDRNQNVFSNFYDSNNSLDDTSEFSTIANQKTQIRTAKLDYNLPIDDNASFAVGGKYSNVNTKSAITQLDIINGSEVINAENSDAFDYDENVFAGYVNFSKSWDAWELNVGVRVEKTEIEGASFTLNETKTQSYSDWFPNASLSYQLSEDVSVYGSYKRSITRPNYTNINPFSFFLNENTVVVGNPNLIPTYRDHYKIGTSFLEYFTVEAYYMNYEGAINELPRQNNETNVIAFTPTNLDRTVDYGFDFAFDYYITNNWSLYAVTSFYNITEEIDFGDSFVGLSQWSNYSVLANDITFLEDSSLNLNLTLTWIGKSVISLSTVEDRLFSSLSVSKSFCNKKAVLSLAVEDIFNYQNETYNVNYLDQSRRSFTDVDSRYIKLGFRYKFGNTKLSTNERSTDVEERERLKDLN